VFDNGKHFQYSLMFAGKVGAYSSEAPFMFSTLEQTPDHKHWTRLERLAKDKHSYNDKSLNIRKFVN
jgi:hypothetical protein